MSKKSGRITKEKTKFIVKMCYQTGNVCVCVLDKGIHTVHKLSEISGPIVRKYLYMLPFEVVNFVDIRA